MEKTRDFNVRSNCSGMTVFHFLQKVLPHNRASGVAELIRDGFVELNGSTPSSDDKVRTGDFLAVNAAALDGIGKKKKIESLEVLYRDNAVICVNKPAGLSVTPDRRQQGLTALQMVREIVNPDGFHPKPVHRLDKWTSGILLLAMQKEVVKVLGDMFAAHRVKKRYLAFVRGWPDPPEGVVDEPIGPNSKRMTRIVVNSKQAKPAITHYKTVRNWQGFSLMDISLQTGRTHQIRVHMSHMGHPVLCDSLYGGGDSIRLSELKVNYKQSKGKKEKPLCTRQALHASSLEFISPDTGQNVRVEAKFPHDLEVLQNKMNQYGNPSS